MTDHLDQDAAPSTPSPTGVVAPPSGSLADGEEDETAPDHGRIGYGRWARFTPLLLAALIVLGLGWVGLARGDDTSPPPPPPAITERLAPDVTVRLLDGARLPLADLRGNVVVLNFWASWCEPCRDEAPILQRLHEEVAASGETVRVVGVGTRMDQDDDARAFVRTYGLTFPIGRDNDTTAPGVGPIERAFGVTLLPTTIVVRPDGVVDRFHLGPISDQQLRFAIDEARSPAP